MSQYFEIHPTHPQLRLVHQAVEIIDAGGVIAYPTDSSYALGCHIGDKKALERMRRIRKIDDKHNLTLVCSDLSEISTYAKINNPDYRMLKSLTPGPYISSTCFGSRLTSNASAASRCMRKASSNDWIRASNCGSSCRVCW